MNRRSGSGRRGRWGAAACKALLGGWLVAGCVNNVPASAFASDFECTEGVATENTDAPGRYVVEGCGQRATYQCVGGHCSLQAASEQRPSGSGRREETGLEQDLNVSDGENGAVMALKLALDQRGLLHISAAPEKQANVVQLKLMRAAESNDASCELDWMVNGQRIQMPKAVVSRKENVLSHRVRIGPDLINELAVATKVSMRTCRERYQLTPDQVEKIRAFMERFQEEMAWSAKPREGTTGGMLAPSGGWPSWHPSGAPAAAVTGADLDASALFKKLSASVFQLEATLRVGASQGSAVAVSETELLTNCHVVQGAVKLELRHEQERWPASVVRADPPTDRCVITAAGRRFVPVAGVRSYDSLAVGEAVYTLGSPVGLELTLASGIVSGRREEDGRRFVQTTAAISPGSSGGGLFDARGNLVGVTTLALIGRERMNQALNFAIPADEFWRK